MLHIPCFMARIHTIRPMISTNSGLSLHLIHVVALFPLLLHSYVARHLNLALRSQGKALGLRLRPGSRGVPLLLLLKPRLIRVRQQMLLRPRQGADCLQLHMQLLFGENCHDPHLRRQHLLRLEMWRLRMQLRWNRHFVSKASPLVKGKRSQT